MSQIRTTDWDAIMASTPNDKTAALVTGSGTHWDPEVELYVEGEIHSETPLPTIKIRSFLTNYTNKHFNRLKVIGAYAEKAATWVVLCTCGMHEVRSNAELSSPEHNKHAMCKRCAYTEEIKLRGGRSSFHEYMNIQASHQILTKRR